jgi:GT2 family glycosyltransferase
MTDRIPAASVVICVFNRAAQVVACLNSLLRLDFPDFEIVVVDDGSTDDTPARLASFRHAHPDRTITVLRLAQNSGPSRGRNAGIGVARGRYLVFTDSDCIVEPHWLRAILKGFHAPDVAAVMGWGIDAPPRNWAERAYVVSPQIRPEQSQRRGLIGNNMAFRRDVVAHFLFDEALPYYCEETDLARRLLVDGWRIGFVRDAVVHHDHPMTVRKFLRLSLLQARGSARFWYKHGVYFGPDLWPMTAALVTSPLGLINAALLLIPLTCLLLQIGIIANHEIALKGKGFLETVQVMPLCIAYYCCRWWGVLWTYGRLLCGGEQALRDSKRNWLQHKTYSPNPDEPLSDHHSQTPSYESTSCVRGE